VLNAWLTFFRKGKLLMSRPTFFFGPDGSCLDSGKNKVYLRTLLYSIATRGQVDERMHISLHRNESKKNFNIWVYGEKWELKKGNGFYVPQEGVTFDHYFLLPADGGNFSFLEWLHKITTFAKQVGQNMPIKISKIDRIIGESHAQKLTAPNNGLYFDWGSDQQPYQAHIQSKSEKK
jgi:hypothetical protein